MNYIYFSPTGSTKKVMDIIGSIWNENVHEIDLSHPIEKYHIEDELTIIGVPSYAGRVPKIASSRLKQITAQNAPVILLVTYGNRAYEDTLLELKDCAIASGFQPIGAIGAVCEHSIMHEFAKGRPNVQDIEELQSFAKQIKRYQDLIIPFTKLEVDGNFPYRAYGGLPLHPKTNKNCTMCGLCISMCPLQAISKEDKIHTDTNACITCMRCIQLCPQHARSLPSLLVKAASKKLYKQCSEPKKNNLFKPQF